MSTLFSLPINSERIDRQRGLELLQETPLLVLGRMAFEAKRRVYGDRVTFIRNRQINPTNRCVHSCAFCDFSTKGESRAGYELTEEEILNMTGDPDIREVHITGALSPSWNFQRSVNLVRSIRDNRPALWIKAFNAVEIAYFTHADGGIPIDTVLATLIKAGVNQLPGGGAEVLNERIRGQLCPEKISAREWLDIHRRAHEKGLMSNATLLFGHIETDDEIIDHLLALRQLQDATCGFQSFVPLLYQPGKRKLVSRQASSPRCLRIVALSRLLLDNIPHIKAYWPSLQIETASAALNFGADDLDGTLGKERIMQTAGSPAPDKATHDLLSQIARHAGQELIERDGAYHYLNTAE